MKNKDLASQFSVCLLHPPGDEGIHLQSELARAGYDIDLFTDEESCLRRIEKKSPHILVLYTQSLKTSLSDVVERMMKYNEELRWIAVTSSPQFDILAQYQDYGCVDIVVEDAAGLEGRIRWSVEKVCHALFLQFQNEQLYADLKNIGTPSASAGSSLPPDGPLSLTEVLKSYALTTTPEETLSVYLERAPQAGIFLRYVDATKSFIVQNVSTEADNARGLGFQGDFKSLQEFMSQVKMGFIPPVLQTLCDRNLSWSKIIVLVLDQGGILDGLIVHPMIDDNQTALVFDYFRVFELYLENRALKERVQKNAVIDPQTDLFNFTYYTAKLKEEMERARRLHKPLSLVKLAIDDFIEIEQSLGENTRDHLIKSLADKIRSSGRANDINTRTKTNEFSLILPHSSKKGALVRAERLRRMMEGQSIADYGVKVSISLGISEFPTLCSNAETLDMTASQALSHITDKGGNKIAVYKPAGNHQPEFQVLEDEV